MTRPATPETIPEPSVGDRCFFCPNIHGQQLSNRHGQTQLTAYKNGKMWVLVCQPCGRTCAQRIIDRPIAPPQISCEKGSTAARCRADEAHMMPPDKIYELENQLVADILLEFGAKPYMRIWRSNTGKAYGAGKVIQLVKAITQAVAYGNIAGIKKALEEFRGQRPITFGTPGTSDICGIIRIPALRGRWICIEAKIGNNKPSEDQVNWREMMESHGAIYILCYQVSDVYLGLRGAGVIT